MKWQVTGASLRTGRDVKVVFDAASVDEVEDMASRAGIAVSSIEMQGGTVRLGHDGARYTPDGRMIVAVEKTSKKYKGLMLMGVALVFISLFLSAALPEGLVVLGGGIGVILFIGAWIGAWWDHG